MMLLSGYEKVNIFISICWIYAGHLQFSSSQRSAFNDGSPCDLYFHNPHIPQLTLQTTRLTFHVFDNDVIDLAKRCAVF